MSTAGGSTSTGTTGPFYGIVTIWDDPRGIGQISRDDGAEFGFHCTAMADGTRSTEVGRRVVFLLKPGPLGLYEATQIVAAEDATL
jgi:cold shock CspA family protein